MSTKQKIELGSKVRDSVTGFTGIAMGRSTFMTGCDRIGIQPPVGDDGKLPEAQWFDEPLVDVLAPPADRAPVDRDIGGPMPSTPTRPASPR